MSGITNKTMYALLIMMDLTKNYDKKILHINDFARNGKIPKSFLIQLLNKLKNLNLIESFRGNKGGYKLSKSPEETTLLEIVEKLEGGFEIFDNYKHEDYIKVVFNKIVKELKSGLNISLKELYSNQEKLDKNIMYFI